MADLIHPTSEISADQAPRPVCQLRLKTHISGEFLDRVETELLAILHDCLMAHRSRFIYPKFRQFLFSLLKPLSILGLSVTFFLIATCRNLYTIRLGIACGTFFAVTLALSWNKNKLAEKLDEFYRPYWKWLAKTRVKSMLRIARKMAPFDAEYDFRGDLAAYYRTTNESAKFVWVRRLKGFRLAGSCFTLFFKKEKSIYPYAIILHEASAEFESYLEEAGMRPIQALRER